MVRVLVILVLVMAFSTFAYHSVQHGDTARLLQENEQLRKSLDQEKVDRVNDAKQLKLSQDKICDALVLLFPEKSKEIKAAFDPKVVTSVTVQLPAGATSQPIEK